MLLSFGEYNCKLTFTFYKLSIQNSPNVPSEISVTYCRLRMCGRGRTEIREDNMHCRRLQYVLVSLYKQLCAIGRQKHERWQERRKEGLEWDCEADEKSPKRLGILARRLDGFMQLMSVIAIKVVGD